MRLDPAQGEALVEVAGVVAAVSEQLVGPIVVAPVARSQRRDRVDQREQMATLVVVATADADA
jgi:hypothetical protein